MAKADLQDISRYTRQTWGKSQARTYVVHMRDRCQWLAGNPNLGRLYGSARPGLRRMEQGSHVIFYRETSSGVLITRILHRGMLPGQHALET
jgi:toxin ParE1/3/4